jgi:hypothetical protein
MSGFIVEKGSMSTTVLFIYGLFNDAFSSSQHMASNDRVINE